MAIGDDTGLCPKQPFSKMVYGRLLESYPVVPVDPPRSIQPP
jgi:hypothetical protein